MNLDRRAFLGFGGAALVAGVILTLPGRDGGADAKAGDFPFRLTDAQWRQRLNPAQYATLRQAATERPFSSPLDHEHRRGIFHCAGCGQPLYSSTTKFDSGTGWPSFFRPLPHAIVTR
ncbi:MAG: peptide-methionine (R)-S-oxide reductase, partial [Sphingomonadaceae bacterium]|nr:peptide-methionine (R)-S-oxide reductase [Sphingomonadaceae bacterium]